ncbi:MAG TPA: site-specific integrase [Acidimicrobiales bacterium]|nr:site-specific integrase [Acidimicrobiales bacterium]
MPANDREHRDVPVPPPPGAEGLTVRDYLIDAWLPAARSFLRPGTYSGYAVNVRAHLVPGLGPVLLVALDPVAINAFYGSLLANRDRPLAPATVRRVHATLRRALGDGVRWGYLDRNPAAGADPPWAPRREMPVWDARQVARFLRATCSDPQFELWLFYFLTGVRRGEALALRWSDVDLEAATVTIRRSLLVVDHRLQIGEPKTARGRRQIAIDPHLVEALSGLRRRQGERGAGGPDELVFARPDGRPLHPEQVTRRFNQLSDRAGLPPARLHGARHAHATLASGVDARIISARLGHSQVATTADIYQHALPGLDREAAVRIAGVVFAFEDPDAEGRAATDG